MEVWAEGSGIGEKRKISKEGREMRIALNLEGGPWEKQSITQEKNKFYRNHKGKRTTKWSVWKKENISIEEDWRKI